ncbi:chemoreceptor glutamine deamidase CheD [Alteromonas sediminis]|uniref:Probable chemoreceptor glutamine deamidase CheD n=1 Tax=Alteromonas sediminis TaxID=2259342 RepID=A0A3N5YA55_9ALTE|nr:chemoreceptor glutamine deamidase CheD [Alteromonas sediminis]RPJ68339.1 chemoreceptor glutamine deamidase CheD [Alteromonas sediminis]
MSVQPCQPGFEHINRYFDRQVGMNTAKILPGEFYISQQKEIITTVLGSCISVCAYDLQQQVGGMNHFLLPMSRSEKLDLGSEAFRYGDVAMEQMINALLKLGAERRRLQFKAFGGGQIIKTMTPIGESNISFLKKFMALEGFKIEASDMGGPYPRKVRFDPLTGQVWVKRLAHLHNDTISKREADYQKNLNEHDQSGEIDLFE